MVLALLLSRVAGAAEPPGDVLPGLAPDVLAAAASLERTEPSAGDERSCPWCTGERARRWAPALGLTAASLAVWFGAEPPDRPRWDSRNAFDDGIREGLAGDSKSTREASATASTVLLAGLGAAFAADQYLLRDEYPLEQSLVVALTTTGGTVLATGAFKAATGRERPYVRRCRTDPRYSDSCNSQDDNASFFSLHASGSATLASLLCARRLSRRDVRWADRLACATAASASIATGLLRVAADEHYFTDVLAGWGVGVAFGAALPLMLPRWSGIGDDEATVTPMPGALGLQYTSRF